MKTPRNQHGATCLSVAITALLCSGCDRSTSPGAGNTAGARTESTVPVTLATASSEDVPIQVNAIGWAEALASVRIRPQIEGQLTEIHFHEGQQVKTGDLLFRIDPRPLVAELRLKEATLLKDQALAADAERESARIMDLFQRNMAADRERDQTKANADAARAQVDADKAEVDTARLRLEYCEIRSPIDGRAGARLVDQGNIVKANDTDLVMINQITPIYVTFAVAERHLPRVKEQMSSGPLSVEVSFNDEDRPPSRGTLTFIDNQVDTLSGMVRMKATFANEDMALWPGRFVNVALTITTLQGAVVVPTPAIQTGQKGAFVYVVTEGDIAELRPVTIGPALGGKTVISTGVSAGEVVVTDGHLRVVPGAKVQNVEAQLRAHSPGRRAAHDVG